MIGTILAKALTCPLLLFQLLFGSILLFILGVILYRLTLHPLANYPGPLLAKFTDLYLAYHAWKGDRHLLFWQCHEKYGPVVRLGPNLLSFNTSTALKTIYGFKANVRKSDFYSAFPANKDSYSIHSSIDRAQHARKRRVISHAFADQAIKSMEKFVLNNIDVACGLIDQDIDAVARHAAEKKGVWGMPRNIARWTDWLTFDIMGDLVFGKAFGMLEEEKNRFAVDLVSSAAHRHMICGTHLTIHNWHLDKILFPKIATKRAQYMAYSKAQAVERTKLGEDADRKDFFYYLLNAKDPETGKGFSPAELWGESNLFIIAGSDTTSTALAATIFYLSHNTDALARATEEVRTAFTGRADEIVHGPTLTGCHYLRACIDEAMRMSPPVPGALPRRVLPGGITVDGYTVPADVDVCVPHYALHRNSEYFPDPSRYDPSRWLVDHPPTEAFAPFSVGPRGCIGKGMAYVELTTTLATLLFKYDLRMTPGTHAGEGRLGSAPGRDEQGTYQLKDTFTSLKDGPVVQFRRRI